MLLFISCSLKSQVKNDNYTQFIPFYHDPKGSLMIVDGVLDSHYKGRFEIDSGLYGVDMILDSAFFYNHFDTTIFHKEIVPIQTAYYKAKFSGQISLRIGTDTLTIESFSVQNLAQTKGSRNYYQGIIGSRFFEDKITIIDFEKRELAFVESIQDTLDYAVLSFSPLRNESLNKKIRCIDVMGLIKKENVPIPARLIFDTGNASTAISLKHEFGVELERQLYNINSSIVIGSWNLKLKQIKGQIDSIAIGPFYLKKPVVGFCQQGGIMDPLSQINGGEGLLGLGILVRFNLIVDYVNQKLYIKPNDYFYTGAPYLWNTTRDSIYQNHLSIHK